MKCSIVYTIVIFAFSLISCDSDDFVSYEDNRNRPESNEVIALDSNQNTAIDPSLSALAESSEVAVQAGVDSYGGSGSSDQIDSNDDDNTEYDEPSDDNEEMGYDENTPSDDLDSPLEENDEDQIADWQHNQNRHVQRCISEWRSTGVLSHEDLQEMSESGVRTIRAGGLVGIGQMVYDSIVTPKKRIIYVKIKSLADAIMSASLLNPRGYYCIEKYSIKSALFSIRAACSQRVIVKNRSLVSVFPSMREVGSCLD